MQAKFGIEREMHNKLFYKESENDQGAFHFHSQIELCVVDEGEMEVLINDKKRCLKAGEMSVSLSFDAHAYRPAGYSRSSILIIPLYMCSEFKTYIKEKRVIHPFICNKEIVQKIKTCFNEIKCNDINEIKKYGLIYTILGYVIDGVCFEKVKSSVETELFSKILLYLHENYKNNVSLSLLSSYFGYSKSYISRYFKSRFNIGINEYLTIIRLKNSIMLMRENNYSITQCALDSGFNSLRTFYRAFYNKFGCSPKDYIKEINS